MAELLDRDPCRSSSRVRSSACPGAHRQRRLGPVERLHLALLVDARHDGTFGRQQVKPNYIRRLLDEQQMGRELERLATVRLQPEGPPDAMHRRCRMSDLFGHGSQGPWFPGSSASPLRLVKGERGKAAQGGGNAIVVAFHHTATRPGRSVHTGPDRTR